MIGEEGYKNITKVGKSQGRILDSVQLFFFFLINLTQFHLLSVAQPSFISINCTYFNTLLQHFIWEYFSFDIYWLIFSSVFLQASFNLCCNKTFFSSPALLSAARRHQLNALIHFIIKKLPDDAARRPRCCTSTSCFIGRSTFLGPRLHSRPAACYENPLFLSSPHWHAHIHVEPHEFMHYLFRRYLAVWNVFVRPTVCLQFPPSGLSNRGERKKKKALQTNWREVQIRMRQADKCSSGSHYTAGFVTTHKDWLGKHNSWIIRSVSFAVFFILLVLFLKVKEKDFPKFVLSSRAAQEEVLPSRVIHGSSECPAVPTCGTSMMFGFPCSHFSLRVFPFSAPQFSLFGQRCII